VGSNLGLCSEKPATNRLNHDTAASAAVPVGNSPSTNSIEDQTGCREGLEAAEKQYSEEENVGN